MKFRRMGTLSLAAILMATSTAIVASADDAVINGTIEYSDFGAQLYGMGTTNWSWVTGGQGTFEESDGKGTLKITAKGSEMNSKGDPTVQFGLQFYIGTDAKGNGELAIDDKYTAKVTYKITAGDKVIKEETVEVTKQIAKNQWGAGIDGTYTLYSAEIPKAELEGYGDIEATVELSDVTYTKGGKDGKVTSSAAAAEETKEEEKAEETTKEEETKSEETKAEETTENAAAAEDAPNPAAAEEEEDAAPTLISKKTSGEYNAEFAAQFDADTTDEWPSFSDLQISFDYDKEVTLGIDMGKTVKFGSNYIAVNTDVPFVEGIEAEITSFKLDGEEVEMGDAFLNSEGINGGLRLTIANKWNDQIAEQPVDPDELGEFQTIEVSFIVNTPDEALTEETLTEDTAEEEAAEPDWSAYDEAAAKANNDSFALGGKIDLYAALGEKWDKFTKVEADFTWDAGTGWCGGAGIGGGADVEGGSGWIAGPEFGAANGNASVVDDGKVTQTIIDLDGNTLAQVAAVDKDGNTTFGELQVQNWWNGTEANAKVTAIRFLDATGSVVAELTYGADAAIEETGSVDAAAETPAVVDTPAETKSDNPSTGVTDIAGAAAIAMLAAGTFVFTRKRK